MLYSFTTNTEVYTWNTFNRKLLMHLMLCTPSATKPVEYRHLNTDDRDSGASQLHGVHWSGLQIILGLIKDPNLVITDCEHVLRLSNVVETINGALTLNESGGVKCH